MERASYNTSRFSSLFGVRKTFNFLFIDFTSKAKLNNSSLCYLQGVEHIKSLKINIKALQMNHISIYSHDYELHVPYLENNISLIHFDDYNFSLY